jgi:uncharacterized protein (DUF736 family)
LATFSNLERGEIGTITLRHLADLAKGDNGSGDNAASFGITNRGLDFDQARKKFGKEGSDCNMGVDKLGHVVDDTNRTFD